MASTGADTGGETDYTTREAAAVFNSAKELQSAVDALLEAGFERSDLSVLGSEEAIREKFGADIPSVSELADNPETPRGTFVSSDARTEGEAAIAGIPVYLGGAGAAAVAALEGATILATAGAALGVGLAAGAVGLYAARRMEKRHADQIEKHLKDGGLILWVRAEEKPEEVKALEVLRNSGAHDIRVHTITEKWGTDAVPFHDAQPDPFFGKD